jgi:hypothetical protein
LIKNCHKKQDDQSLALAKAVAKIIDTESEHQSVLKAKSVLKKWLERNESPGLLQWAKILEMDWETIKTQLLAENDVGQQLRQNSPFCGILSSKNRWQLIRNHEAT